MGAADVLEFDQFLGPLGGLLSVAFAMGCIAGWGFAMKLMKSRIDDLKADMAREREECREDISELKAQIKTLNDFMLHGMERQLAQVRQSSVAIIRGDPS